MPGYGIRANDNTIVSHHLPVKFLVRQEAFKSKAKTVYLLNLKKPGGVLKISLTSGGETAKCLLSRLEPEGRYGGAMKFAPIAVAPETWPP